MDGHGCVHPVASGASNTDGSAQTQGSNRNHGNEIPRARRSVVDRFLRKEEALGSNPSESIGASEFTSEREWSRLDLNPW